MEIVHRLIGRERSMSIPSGYYTKKNLPPLSSKAQKILGRIEKDAEKWKRSPEGIMARARAEAASKEGRFADAIGIMLGAEGYEKK